MQALWDTKAPPKPKRTKLECERYAYIRRYVIDYLKEGWSPQQIVGRLKAKAGLVVIFIYSKMGKSLSLYQYLRTRRKKRWPKISRKKRTLIPNRTCITVRPQNINDRSEFGHWECDLMQFRRGCKTNLIALCERLTRYVVAIKNSSRKPDDVLDALTQYFRWHDVSVFKSITFDNGVEFIGHEKISSLLNQAKTYFCEPYKSYQKGAIENANKFLREYFPRNCAIDDLSQLDIDQLVVKLNDRPMACLGYQKPYELYRTKANHIQ